MFGVQEKQLEQVPAGLQGSTLNVLIAKARRQGTSHELGNHHG